MSLSNGSSIHHVVGADDGLPGSLNGAVGGVDNGSADGDYNELFENPDNMVSDLLKISYTVRWITCQNVHSTVLRGQGIKPEKLKGVPGAELVQRLLTDR